MKDLKYFMREYKEEIITAPAPDTFKNDAGKVIDMQVRVLSQARIQEINEKYKKRSIATDKKGQPYLGAGNEVVFKTERDSARASRHIIVEALAFPDLKDPKLMEFYGCVDITEMPLKVFPTAEEFAHVNRVIMAALGLGGEMPSSEEDDKDLEDAKN